MTYTVGMTDKSGLRHYDNNGNAIGYFETKRGNTLEVHKNPSHAHPSEYKYSMFIREERPLGESLEVVMTGMTLASPDYFINLYRERY